MQLLREVVAPGVDIIRVVGKSLRADRGIAAQRNGGDDVVDIRVVERRDGEGGQPLCVAVGCLRDLVEQCSQEDMRPLQDSVLTRFGEVPANCGEGLVGGLEDGLLLAPCVVREAGRQSIAWRSTPPPT